MAGNLIHGLSTTPEYRAWQTMRLRCYNPKNAAYPAYGGRGITVCDRWKDDVCAFVADMGLKPSPKHELDRRDNNAGYSPENCRWVLRTVNDRNRRNNHFLTLHGDTRTMAEWCEILGLGKDTLSWRIRKGWSVERALLTPARPKRPSANLARETFTQAVA